jgi:hypothetical protein
LLGVSFSTSAKSDFMHNSNDSNTTEHNRIISNAQNTTALQPSVRTVGIRRLLVTNKGMSGLPQHKPLKRSTANTTVSNKDFGYNMTEGAQIQTISTKEICVELFNVFM